MEVEVSLALASGVSAVLIAGIAAIIAICSCKYARKTQSSTDEEATQVDVVHEQWGFSFFGGCLKYNDKKDNIFIKNGSATAFNSTDTKYETTNNETANILAGGAGLVHFGERGLDVIETLATKNNNKNDNPREIIVKEISENKIHNNSSKDGEDKVNLTATLPINIAQQQPLLAEFLECHNPANQGVGGEKFTALLAQPPIRPTTPRNLLSEQDKKTVEPVATKWFNIGQTKKKDTDQNKVTTNKEKNKSILHDTDLLNSNQSTKTMAEIVGFKQEPEEQETNFIELPTNDEVQTTGNNSTDSDTHETM